MKLWRADFHVPFAYFGDSVLYSIAAKGTIENGWWLHNKSVGAPEGLEYAAYPAMENFHFALIKLISIFSSDHALVINLFYLLTFPLTAITSFYVFRHFRFSLGAALLASLLYTFLPYHFFRSYHLLMAAYYPVPLIVLVMLWICSEERFLFIPHERYRWPRIDLKSRKTILSIIVCVIMGSCGVYYPFFAVLLLLLAGLVSCCNQRTIYPLLTSLVLIGVVGATLLINHLPSIRYQQSHGRTAMGSRSVGDAEIMGLKITQLVLPIGGHRLEPLGALRYRYNLGPLVNENDTASPGFVGAVGFLILIAALFIRRRTPPLLQHLTWLNLGALLLGTIGGFGVLFALLISPQIRAYNRISVYIAFFSLTAIAYLLDLLFRKLRTRPQRLLYHLGLLVVLVLGVLDQTTTTFFFVPEYEKIKSEYQSDADFINQIETSIPAGSMVFQLPYVPFPESPSIYHMIDHEHFKAYLHSRSLRWSYGVPAGEAQDAWQRTVVAKPVNELVSTIRTAGFNGLYLNRDAYEDHGAKMESELTSVLGVQPIVSRKGNLAFFKLAQ